jgi:hypothetical protein
MVPFQPIIEQGEKPFAMLQDLWIKHRDWIFEPIEYSSVDSRRVGSYRSRTRRAVTALIRRAIEEDRFPRAPPLDPLRSALAKLERKPRPPVQRGKR